MTLYRAQFNAAADQFSNGAIFLPEFQPQILDMLRREGSVLAQRLMDRYTPATGSPSRWFEQTAIATAQFDTKSALAPSATSPTRGEKALQIKAITGRIQYNQFDLEVANQQGQFAELKAKDMRDMVASMVVLHGKALWQGTDVVNGGVVGNGGLQYVSLMNQISTSAVDIDTTAGAKIVRSLRLSVAKLVSDPLSNFKPTAIYMNPLALYLLENEMEQTQNTIAKVEVVAGVSVSALQTAAGLLPLVPDFALAANLLQTPSDSSKSAYPYAIVDESRLEYHYVGDKLPRVYQLGLVSNLIEDYVGVMYGAPVLKAGDRAHIKGSVIATSL